MVVIHCGPNYIMYQNICICQFINNCMVPILFLYTFTLFLHTIVIMVGTGDRIPKLKVKKKIFWVKGWRIYHLYVIPASSHQHNIIDLYANVCAWHHSCDGSIETHINTQRISKLYRKIYQCLKSKYLFDIKLNVD